MEQKTGAQAFVEVLNASGVRRVYFNPGIDTVPILEAISMRRESGNDVPEPILCPHEAVAMTAALADHMMSAAPQVVLVHSELGTQQIGGAVHNAQWGRIPVVLCAGLSSYAGRKTWTGENYDQASSVRNCVKWDHQLTESEDIADVLSEALNIAMTDPRGPVYLTWPMQALTRESAASIKGLEIPNAVLADEDINSLNKAADILMQASHPLIVTGYCGRNLDCVAHLVKLAEILCAPVVSADIRMNFPSTHPLFAYREPNARSMPHLDGADAVLVIDYDVPYASGRVTLRPEAKIVHIDVDTEKRGLPLWNREAHVNIQGDSSLAIPVLTGMLEKRRTPEQHSELRARFEHLRLEHDSLHKKWHSIAAESAKRSPISSDWLCHCIGQAIDKETVVVNQALRASASLQCHIDRVLPGTLIASAGGTMGWALGAGLGAKLAAPDRTVVSLMGDGVFVYGSPVATLWTASRYRAPFLSVIFNNQGYSAIRGLFRRKYDVDNMGADMIPSPDFAAIARGCKAFGRTVGDPSDITEAFRDALEHVHSGQAAVLDVRIGES